VRCSPSERVNGALKPELCAAVASNWVVAQNFLTRTALTENFFPVSFSNKSKLKPPIYPNQYGKRTAGNFLSDSIQNHA